MKRDQSEEKKIPKGVPLQFDINSVGKQVNTFSFLNVEVISSHIKVSDQPSFLLTSDKKRELVTTTCFHFKFFLYLAL